MPHSRTALIIDDDEGVRLFVQAVLEGEGWNCIEARNGEEGIDLALAREPSLILLDVQMPGLDGFETYQRLRNSPFTESIPIVMLTGINAENGVQYGSEDFEAAFDLPAPEGFLDKPVDARLLLDCVMGVTG